MGTNAKTGSSENIYQFTDALAAPLVILHRDVSHAGSKQRFLTAQYLIFSSFTINLKQVDSSSRRRADSVKRHRVNLGSVLTSILPKRMPPRFLLQVKSLAADCVGDSIRTDSDLYSAA